MLIEFTIFRSQLCPGCRIQGYGFIYHPEAMKLKEFIPCAPCMEIIRKIIEGSCQSTFTNR